MQGDLISRSALIEEIESLTMQITGLRSGKGVLSECMKEYKKSILRIIDEQPTAYDVEKVVKQIESWTVEVDIPLESLPDIKNAKIVRSEIAIDFVRNGGKE